MALRDEPTDDDVRAGFYGVSAEKLNAMSDIKLAEWQANQQPGSVRFILAENEWKMRLMRAGAAQGARYALLGVVIGAALTALFAWLRQ